MGDILVQVEPHTPEAALVIRDGLREFNYSVVGRFQYDQVLVTARDSTGAIVGGSYGGVYLEWLYVEVLWVRQDFRKQGLGR